MKKQTSTRFEITEALTPLDFEKYSGSLIDILIPAHNSGKTVDGVILNLASQATPKDSRVRITVCANACKDNTVKVAQKALEKARLKNKNKSIDTSLIITAQPGEPEALNRMLKKVDNEIIIVVNDDVFPSKDSLAKLYISMRKYTDLGAIGIPSRPLPEHTGKQQILSIRIVNQIRKLYAEKDITIIGQMYAFRKSLVDHFPKIMSEDNYLTYSSLLKSKGYGIIKDKLSFVYYKPPSTYEDVFSQTFMHSLSGTQFFREYPKALNRFIEIQERIPLSTEEEPDEDQPIRNIAQQIQDCCWQMAVLADKHEPFKGSARKRINSTL